MEIYRIIKVENDTFEQIAFVDSSIVQDFLESCRNDSIGKQVTFLIQKIEIEK